MRLVVGIAGLWGRVVSLVGTVSDLACRGEFFGYGTATHQFHSQFRSGTRVETEVGERLLHTRHE